MPVLIIQPEHDARSYRHRLTEDLKAQSLVPPGTPDSFFQVLYVLPHEALNEVQNATVHAFLTLALEERTDGYRLYWGVYIKPVSWITPVYMALINPFRRWIVYPTLLKRLQHAWMKRYAS